MQDEDKQIEWIYNVRLWNTENKVKLTYVTVVL